MSRTFSLPNLNDWYEKDPKLSRDSVTTLLKWLETQPHLPELLEMQVICFLHACNYNIEHAQRTIENYFTGKTKMASIVDSASEDVVRNTLTTVGLSPMPKRTPGGCTVFIFALIDPRSEVYSFLNQIKVYVMLLTLHLKQEGYPEGVICVFDCKGYHLAHMVKVPLGVASKITSFVENSLPVKVKGLHFINLNSIAQRMLNLFKRFMNKELHDLINVHSSLEDLYEQIPKDCLPVELGGCLPSFLDIQEIQKANVLSNMDYFRYLDGQKVDESKRAVAKSGYFNSFWHKIGF